MIQLTICIIGILLTLFFIAHYCVLIVSLAKVKKYGEFYEKRFHLIVHEYKTFCNCVQALNEAQTDEERQKILDIMSVNASTSILRNDDLK